MTPAEFDRQIARFAAIAPDLWIGPEAKAALEAWLTEMRRIFEPLEARLFAAAVDRTIETHARRGLPPPAEVLGHYRDERPMSQCASEPVETRFDGQRWRYYRASGEEYIPPYAPH